MKFNSIWCEDFRFLFGYTHVSPRNNNFWNFPQTIDILNFSPGNFDFPNALQTTTVFDFCSDKSCYLFICREPLTFIALQKRAIFYFSPCNGCFCIYILFLHSYRLFPFFHPETLFYYITLVLYFSPNICWFFTYLYVTNVFMFPFGQRNFISHKNYFPLSHQT